MPGKFPSNFLWGAATAAYQIEGAVREDGRGESIWDRFSHTPGKIENGDTGDIACDHYHQYPTDLQLMKELGIQSYRFSIAWPRIFPTGKGQSNQAGIDFYHRLIDLLLENEIKPLVTLYHWDLPQGLQDLGGWGNRDIVGYFRDYAQTVFEAYGDRVDQWITLNEPWVFAFAGNYEGIHAPGKTDLREAIRVSHHALLAHFATVKTFREANPPSHQIGIALSLSPTEPASANQADQIVAAIADGFLNRWFLDPVLKGTYPQDLARLYQAHLTEIPNLDEAIEGFSGNPVDFIGVNYYFRTVVRYAPEKGIFGYEKVNPTGKYTEMGWEVYPEGLFKLLARIAKDYQNPPVYITENGAAFLDNSSAAAVIEDPDRVAYLQTHLEAAKRAIESGVNLQGYFVWSLLDNFEWAEGLSKRFGLIYVDYQNQQRIVKRSGLWYKNLIRNNGF